MIVLLPIEEIGIGDRAGIEIRFALVQRDELIRLRVWKRIEQHAVHDREQRGVRADGQGERKDGDCGEGWGFREHAQGEFEVLHECDHRQPPCETEIISS